jgi:hypothetical protein
MAKLTPDGELYDLGNASECYADGLEEVDQFGPNSTLTFFIVQRLDQREGAKRVAVLRLRIPTSAIPDMLGLLMKPQQVDAVENCPEQSVH